MRICPHDLDSLLTLEFSREGEVGKEDPMIEAFSVLSVLVNAKYHRQLGF